MDSKFHLSGEDDNFKHRSCDIFSQLDSIKDGLNQNTSPVKPTAKKRSLPLSQSTDDSSNSKQLQQGGKPGYVSEPLKWTRYNLEETNITSDRQNTQAAFAFLHDVAKRRKDNEEIDSLNMSETSVDIEDSFCKPMQVKDQSQLTSTCDKVSFKKPAVHTTHKHKNKMLKIHSSILSTSSDDKSLCDKVELDHLEENLSSTEYQAEIADKLDQSMHSKVMDDIEETKYRKTFKPTSKTQKSRKNVRRRNLE